MVYLFITEGEEAGGRRGIEEGDREGWMSQLTFPEQRRNL